MAAEPAVRGAANSSLNWTSCSLTPLDVITLSTLAAFWSAGPAAKTRLPHKNNAAAANDNRSGLNEWFMVLPFLIRIEIITNIHTKFLLFEVRFRWESTPRIADVLSYLGSRVSHDIRKNVGKSRGICLLDP